MKGSGIGKKLPIIIGVVCAVLCALMIFGTWVLADGENEEVPEISLSAKPLSYLDNKTFFDFAQIKADPVDAVYAMAVNLDTGNVMYEKNPDVLIFPASAVKLMTAIVVFENVPDLDTMIYASENAVKISAGTRLNPTKPIKVGEGFTVRELLYGLLVNGANDCANVLAEYVGGSVDGFCEMMNERAKELGAKNTVFKNPTGLHHPEMKTTVRDLAIISSHAFYINELVKMTGSTNYTIEATNLTTDRRYIYNRNRMIRRVENEEDYFYKGTLGLSSGSTPEGGNCVVAAASRDGLSYLVIVMGADGTDRENYAFRDSVALLDSCFNNFSVQKVVGAGVIQCEIPVELAAKVDHVTLHAAQNISALLPNDLDTEKDILLDNRVLSDAKAPIEKGQTFGELVVKYKGTVTLGTTNLVAGMSIERSNLLYVLSLLAGFFSSRWFIAAAISAVILFSAYCFLYYKMRKSQRRYRR